MLSCEWCFAGGACCCKSKHLMSHISVLLSQGIRNLIAAAQQAKVKTFALVTSIGTDDPLFSLNLLFGVTSLGRPCALPIKLLELHLHRLLPRSVVFAAASTRKSHIRTAVKGLSQSWNTLVTCLPMCWSFLCASRLLIVGMAEDHATSQRLTNRMPK